MRKIWLIFAQSVTACLGVLFVLRLFYPHLLETSQEPIIIKHATQEPDLTPLANNSGTYSKAVKKAMPSVVNIFTSSKKQPSPHQPYMDDPLFKHFFGDQQDNNEDDSLKVV